MSVPAYQYLILFLLIITKSQHGMINTQIYSISNNKFVQFFKVMVDFNFQMDMPLRMCALISNFCILHVHCWTFLRQVRTRNAFCHSIWFRAFSMFIKINMENLGMNTKLKPFSDGWVVLFHIKIVHIHK